MRFHGLTAVVHKEAVPLDWIEHFERSCSMNRNLDLTLTGGVLAVGFTFACRAPGPDSPAVIIHNHPDFLGDRVGIHAEPCYSVGDISSLDAGTTLPPGWQFISKTKHPIFDYALIEISRRPFIVVGDIWQDHFKLNGKLKH